MFLPPESEEVYNDLKRGAKFSKEVITGWGALVAGLGMGSTSSVEIFLRCRFGLNYLIFNGALASLVLSLYYWYWIRLLGRPYAESFGIYTIACLFGWGYHVIAWFLRDEEHHSWSPGEPIGIWDGWAVPYLFRWHGTILCLEPGICLLASAVMAFTAPMLAYWLLAMAIILFFKNAWSVALIHHETRASLDNDVVIRNKALAVQEARRERVKKAKEWVVGDPRD